MLHRTTIRADRRRYGNSAQVRKRGYKQPGYLSDSEAEEQPNRRRREELGIEEPPPLRRRLDLVVTCVGCGRQEEFSVDSLNIWKRCDDCLGQMCPDCEGSHPPACDRIGRGRGGRVRFQLAPSQSSGSSGSQLPPTGELPASAAGPSSGIVHCANCGNQVTGVLYSGAPVHVEPVCSDCAMRVVMPTRIMECERRNAETPAVRQQWGVDVASQAFLNALNQEPRTHDAQHQTPDAEEDDFETEEEEEEEEDAESTQAPDEEDEAADFSEEEVTLPYVEKRYDNTTMRLMTLEEVHSLYQDLSWSFEDINEHWERILGSARPSFQNNQQSSQKKE